MVSVRESTSEKKFGVAFDLEKNHGSKEGLSVIVFCFPGLPEHFACKSPSLLYTVVTNIVAVTACFFILLLFPVNSFYLNL